jgi:photosystem II stability/assembly factor-like uncharacterized protein
VSTLHPTPPMILASTDGGAHWQVQLAADAGPDSDMTALDFADARHGWAIGGGGRGIVLATGDGGRTWKTLATGASKVNGLLRYTSVSFADARHGWIVANHGVLLTTSDGGATWQAIAPPGNNRLLTGVCAFGPGG